MTPRLVCFHHAGGGAASLHALRTALGPDADFHAVSLPGREARHREPRMRNIEALTEWLAGEVGDLLAEPHVLLGHSMGGLVAYRLAQWRIAAGLRAPEALVVAAYAAPHLPAPLADVDDVPDAALGELLLSFGGLPEQLRERPEWVRAFLPIVRDDIALCGSHVHAGEPVLPCPVHVFGADEDVLVSAADLLAWERHTAAEFTCTMVRGGHFFVKDAPDDFVTGVRRLLWGLTPSARVEAPAADRP
ncbi:thioesterase II family protein [Microbispora sp. NPDC049125]|uniref:thioesterase II family protein n=1 Tax=Microbispora sp. NPDC049125 TaxID=3154929 RepID=UPI0034661AA5